MNGKQYGKCPKILNTKVSDKMAYANSVDPDQTAPGEAVWSGSTLFAIPICNFKKQLHKKRNKVQNSLEESVQNFTVVIYTTCKSLCDHHNLLDRRHSSR